jgi:hypothetical protein
MTGLRSWLAKVLLDHAARTMPAARAEWVRAMQAEAEHLPAREQLPFAIGCVRTSYGQMLTEADTMLRIGRWTIILGLCGAGAIFARAATIIPFQDASAMILALALICLAVAAGFARWGFDRLPMLAVAGFTATLIAMVTIGEPGALLSNTMPSGPFYRAILLEQAVGWGALFAVAHLLLAWESKRGMAG